MGHQLTVWQFSKLSKREIFNLMRSDYLEIYYYRTWNIRFYQWESTRLHSFDKFLMNWDIQLIFFSCIESWVARSVNEEISDLSPYTFLAWKIPWTEEPDWLQSMELQSPTRPNTHTHTHIYYKMITIVFINIHHLKRVNNLFLVMRTFKICSLSNFQLYNTVSKVLLFKWEKSNASPPL